MDCLIHHFLRTQADASPDAEALIDGSSRWSYADVWMQVEALAGALAELGIDRFERVGIQLPNGAEQVVSLLATSASGGVFVPIHNSLLPRQVAHIARDCQFRLLITTNYHWVRLRAELATCADLAHVVLVDGNAGQNAREPEDVRVHALAALTAADCPAPMRRSIDRDLAAILYTSGSTGLPKGVMLSHANLVAGASIVSDYLSISSRDRILAALPFSFDAGLNQLTTAFQQGAALVVIRFLMAKQIVRALESEHISGFAGVPTLWNLLVQSHSFLGSHLPDLRYITNTGGVLPKSTLGVLRKVLVHADVFLMYGLTEAFRSTYLPPDQLDRRSGSIGKAIPNTEIFVVDANDRRCGAGEVGELVHHGPTVSLGYWNRPDETAAVFRPHPFPPPGGGTPPTVCYSGDLARADEDGYLYFVGRKDHQIKTAGFRVSQTEIEGVLHQHPSVAQAAVVGAPDPTIGQSIHAFVTARPGWRIQRDELLAFSSQHLPNHMVPKAIIRCDALPMTPSGKIDYASLRSFAGKSAAPDHSEPC